MDRVEFEELALNGLDPSLGPSISKLAGAPGKEQEQITVCLSLSGPFSSLCYNLAP